MKTILLVFFLTFLPLEAELSVKKIETMVKKIQSKRVSKLKVDFAKVPSPFVVVLPRDENRTESQILKPENAAVQFSLSAIINGRAYLNGSWVSEGDTVAGYRVEKILPDEVLLKKEDKEIRLFLPEKKKTNVLQISEG